MNVCDSSRAARSHSTENRRRRRKNKCHRDSSNDPRLGSRLGGHGVHYNSAHNSSYCSHDQQPDETSCDVRWRVRQPNVNHHPRCHRTAGQHPEKPKRRGHNLTSLYWISQTVGLPSAGKFADGLFLVRQGSTFVGYLQVGLVTRALRTTSLSKLIVLSTARGALSA